MLSASPPIRKAGGGGGGAVRFRPDMKSGGGGGGGGGAVHFRHNTKGGRGGCLAKEGEVPYTKGQLYDLDLLNSARFTTDY